MRGTWALGLLLLGACTTPEPREAERQLSPEAVVQQVVLTEDDLADGVRVALIAGGDEVEGQVTLDECGYAFTSEAARVARRQVDLRFPDETGQYSNEVVAYDTTAAAELALREWRTAVQECPEDRFIASKVEGVPPVRTQLLEFQTIESLPVSDNVVARQYVVSRRGASLHLAVVYQQRGSILDGHYLITPAEPTAEQIERLTEQARTTGSRLAVLPAGDAA